MANNFELAFDDLYEVYCEETGTTPKATINGTPYDCIPTQLTSDTMLIHGGTGENGGYEVMCRRSDFGVSPVKMQTILLYGKTLRVLKFDDTNQATYTFFAEDPTIKR